MRIIAVTALVLAVGNAGASAPPGLASGQGWIVQQQHQVAVEYRL